MKIVCILVSVLIAGLIGFWIPSVFGPGGIILALPVGLVIGFVGALIGEELDYRHRNRY